MRAQVGIETAAGFAQAACVGGDGVHQGADRVGGGIAWGSTPIRLEPEGRQWALHVGRCLTLRGETPSAAMGLYLGIFVLGHDERVSRTVEVGR